MLQEISNYSGMNCTDNISVTEDVENINKTNNDQFIQAMSPVSKHVSNIIYDLM